ncbi:hypothetical protein FM038_017150 [Shewanella eurypsychrophilus]|uniref:Tail assembly chaperone n=1 Tax=Shewanella eurypsychrophilus TaxID=2593656 RepID=A0ABX6VAN6_9GAMM|nr:MULTISPECIES: hypothetical protein [Shewanella]QFU23727.1 hypothetical protein FS418_18940 [Shewanella sp. YLB-09]QPG58947.1 hypothetical protein FM038_017150 [Shewanella eurypsychrophilus]
MALVLAKAAADIKVWRTIKVQMPKDGSDKSFDEMTFKAQFQMMGTNEFKELQDESVEAALTRVWLDAKGIRAEVDSSEDEEFSTELKAQLIDIPWIRTALLKSYLAIPGGKKGN